MHRTSAPSTTQSPPSITEDITKEDMESLSERFDKILADQKVEIDPFISDAIQDYFYFSENKERIPRIEDQIKDMLNCGIFQRYPQPMSMRILELLDKCASQPFFKEDWGLQQGYMNSPSKKLDEILSKKEVEIDSSTFDTIQTYFYFSSKNKERIPKIETQIKDILNRGIFQRYPRPISPKILKLLDMCSNQPFFKEDLEIQQRYKEYLKFYANYFYVIERHINNQIVKRYFLTENLSLLNKGVPQKFPLLSKGIPQKFIQLYAKLDSIINKRKIVDEKSFSSTDSLRLGITSLLAEITNFLRSSEYDDEKKIIILSCLLEYSKNTILTISQLFRNLQLFLKSQQDSFDNLTFIAREFSKLYIGLSSNEIFFTTQDVLPKIMGLLGENPLNIQLINWKITAIFHQHIKLRLHDDEIKILKEYISYSETQCLTVEPNPQLKVAEIIKQFSDPSPDSRKIDELRKNLAEYAETQFFSGLVLLQESKIPEALDALSRSILINPLPLRLNSLISLMGSLTEVLTKDKYGQRFESFFFCMHMESRLTKSMLASIKKIGVISEENSAFYEYDTEESKDSDTEEEGDPEVRDFESEEHIHKTSPNLSPQKDSAPKPLENAKILKCARSLFNEVVKLGEPPRKKAKTESTKKENDEMDEPSQYTKPT